MTAAVSAIQAAIYAALAGYGGVSDMVGSRVFPDVAPQDAAAPFVVWQEITLVPTNDMSGSVETGGLNNYRIQVTSWASGVKGGTLARQVDAQVRAAMIATSGFRSLLIDNRAMPYEGETRRHGMQSDFSVWLRT